MKIFVASWFFPPATSSEGIVTYKLLRNSKHQYHVYSSTSKQWGYKASMNRRQEENIICHTIATDSIEEWVDGCIAHFEAIYPKEKFDCIMTRSTPPESILVGLRVKEKFPDVKWIASLADPVANNPYEIKAYIDDCITLQDYQKTELKTALNGMDPELLTRWESRPESGIRLMCKLKKWELETLKMADLIISPTARQLRYILNDTNWSPKFFAVPHSFDEDFYPPVPPKKTDKVVFSFIGYSDTIRSLEPIVRAVKLLRESNSPALEKLEIRLIGNNPRSITDMILNYYLDEYIKVLPGVDYYKSLELMQQSDWLVHVDAYFPALQPGGSIFFAGKIADYLGAGRPILGLTGKNSPAYEVITKSGGVAIEASDVNEIAAELERIIFEIDCFHQNKSYIQQFSATKVAEQFDNRVESLCNLNCQLRHETWPCNFQSESKKLVTICVPSYNVQRYLERCLRTLLDHPYASKIEVLVIDDGSKDHTAEIAKTFEVHYPGSVRLIQKENGGHGSTINCAIQEGTGKYFMVVDGDDWIDSTQFAKLLSQIESGELDTDVISANYHEVNMESGASSPWVQQADIDYFKPLNFEELDLENVYFTLASSLFKRSVLKQTNMPLQEHTFYVDVEYILFPIPFVKTVTFVEYFIYKYCRGNAEQSVHVPNMLNRFDHHDRVVRRVIKYCSACPMSDAHRTYYLGILKKLLFTHYGLCLVYDDNKTRGYSRAKEFDEFLKGQSSELYRYIGRVMPAARVARKHHFDPFKAEKSLGGKIVNLWNCQKQHIKYSLKHNRMIRKLLINRYSLRIANSAFFQTGKGRKIKQELSRFL